MTLNRVIASLTGRASAAPPSQPAAPAPDPNMARLLESGSLQFTPGQPGEESLGAARDVRRRIAEILPSIVFDLNGRGAFVRTGYTLVFDTGAEEDVRVVRVEVSGGLAAMPPLLRLEIKTGWRLTAAGG
jgi:hypothetical protein